MVSSVPAPLSQLLEKLLSRRDLVDAEAERLMRDWLDEVIAPVETGAFLAAFRSKGATGNELAAMAKVLRDACSLPCPIPPIPLVDTCGTGGDGADTFNISTAVAFTASACGANIAKHGNRSASGKVGSADVLESLGLQLQAPLARVVEVLPVTGVTFLFAPAWHKSLVNLAPLRKQLGVRTVFNLLGPLVNPLKPTAQVLGVASNELLDPMAEALRILGLRKAVVVHGAGGLDEASLAGLNEMRFVENGEITKKIISPEDVGISLASVEDLKGGDLSLNQSILTDVLKGNGTNAQTNVVALNTALVLWASGSHEDLASGVEAAKNCLREGLAWYRLEKLRDALNN